MPIKVLIIDDDASMTQLLGSLLRKQGLEVRTCTSGMEGIETAKKENFDIILLDLVLPGIDGWEACKTLRSMSNTPIAILSAIDDPVLITAALDAGADDYMTKPVTSRVLLAHIMNLTRRHLVESKPSTLLRQVDLGNLSDTSPNPL